METRLNMRHKLDEWMFDTNHDGSCSALCAAIAGEEAMPCSCGYDEAVDELTALRQRCEDLELMLRAALVGRLGIAFDDDNVQWWSLDPSPGWRFKLADDGTGLPILTPEAREELRKR